MTHYTSEQILAAEDLYELQEKVCSMGIPITYQLTAGELGWLKFVRGRYSIADYVDENLSGDTLTINDSQGLSEALDDDCGGWGKAACLSDDTALQRIFFWCYDESWSDSLAEQECK